MNKTIDFSQPGGLYIYQDTLDFLQTAYSLPIDAVISAIGDKIILSGVVDQGANTSAGWITYNGEAIPFLGGLKATYVIIENITGSEQFDDAQQRAVYSTRRAKFGNVIGGLGGFAFAELKPFPFKSASINSALSTIQTVLKNIINFENTVVLDGCTVSNILGSNMAVSAGVIMFSGNVVVSPAYAGAFPAYISELGAWSTVIPGTGLYVKFDPYTSQRYQDVLRRFTHTSGQIIFHKVLSDRFDPVTGVGKWEWLGFTLSTDMRGRTPVGLWFGDNGDTDVYDADYRTTGNPKGSNKHTLTQSELPNITLDTNIFTNSQDYVDGGAAQNNIGTNPAPSNPNGAVINIQTEALGSGTAFDIRQPILVLAIIERD